ncbi:hypothetical protein [Reyranella sp.]|uniref:hypothetical protein n=1 Tax=Reyranella sp. TaxID=1929291 RepID=UPI003BAB5D5C
MSSTSLATRSVVIGLLLLSGCDVAQSMRSDLARLTSPYAATQKPPAKTPARRAQPPVSTASASSTGVFAVPQEPPAPPLLPSGPPPVTGLVGKSEGELRALLGAPNSEEDQPPGKRWRYRDGQCTLDVQLYPDVRTKQYGTLAYEVKTNDDTDEGKRHCLAQLQSRARAGQ